ncbi:MAG: DNA damage-inducible protein D [Ginsengibacter sp.]
MKQEIVKSLFKSFEEASHTQEGVEYWFARELQPLLGYSKWENFQKVIEKGAVACVNAGATLEDHFLGVGKMVDIGSGSQREVDDIMLTRYACYLIAQNGDPRKDEIAFAMSYFAIQTRRQEIIEKRINELERIHAREKLTTSQKELSGIIYHRGVDEMGFGRIISKGDQALFGGFTTGDMKIRLGIPAGKPLADFLPAITIKAKDFANEITNFNIKKEDLKGEQTITHEHVKNNHDVRNLLIQRGIRPEHLPAEDDIKKIERKVKSEHKKVLKETKKLKGKK